MLSSAALLVVLAASASATFYNDCGSTSQVTEVDISGCDRPPCVFKKGGQISLTLKFKANAAAQKVTAKVYGVISGIPVPFPGVESDACKGFTTGSCPMAEGDEIVYQTAIDVLKDYPTLRLVVRWELRDESDKKVVCFTVPAKVQ